MKLSAIKKLAGDSLAPQVDWLAIDLLLMEVLGWSKEKMFLSAEQEVDDDVVKEFWLLFDKLRLGQPVAQLLKKKEFYNLNLFINEHVLIPRPESELVVDLARDYIKSNLADSELIRVLDVGTGSGCILLALVLNEKNVQGVGVDISDQALQVALKNLDQLNLASRVKLLKSDLLQAVMSDEAMVFDVVVANLPYIGTERFNFVAQDVEKFEPAVALFGGSDGLDLYRRMFDQLVTLSWRPKVMIGEFGFGQEEEMRKVLQSYFPDIFVIIPDLAGTPRVFVVDFSKLKNDKL